MLFNDAVLIGQGEDKVLLHPGYANRHGLIAGATGTGKTVSLQCLAESFSTLGVPVFMADVKGDLSGMAVPGKMNSKIQERLDVLQIPTEEFPLQGFPIEFWDVMGEKGTPVRTSVTEMGPQLLSRLLDLNDVQEGLMTLCFEYAENEKLAMLDLKDLNTTLTYLGDNSKELKGVYGRISKASISAIQRRLLTIEREGGDIFFGEPALDYRDFLTTDANGKGTINILAADKLIRQPKIYGSFLLWFLSELFEELPEVGDPDKPTFVFFFDEAHLLFNDAPKIFIQRIEQVVRLIRSKGVSIFFITQNPTDIPNNVLGQLGSRVQHALRAYTPKDRKAIRAAADSFRTNPNLDVETVIGELGVGEALVSVLEDDGIPSIVQRTLIRPPCSKIGPVEEAERKALQDNARYLSKYKDPIDRHSAHEELKKRTEAAAKREAEMAEEEKELKKKSLKRKSTYKRQGVFEAFFKSLMRALGGKLGQKLVRSLISALTGGRR